MSGSVNKVILIGNLTKDPEFRSLGQDGAEVASLRLATNESWKDKNSGERRERAEYHAISVFNEQLIRVIRDYCRKGQQLYIEGQLQTRKWQDADGNDKYTTEVVLQRYRGELTMLNRPSDEGDFESRSGDGDRGGRQDDRGGRGDDRGGRRDDRGGRGGDSRNDSRGGGGNRGGGNAGGGRGGYSDDLDDDVPF